MGNKRIQTDIGSIPSNWECCEFYKIAMLKHGHQFRTNDFTEDGVKIFKITQINTNGGIDISNCDFIDNNRISEFEDKILKKGDILMALTGATIGKIAKFNSDEIVLQNYRVGNFLSINESILSKEYLYYFLSSNFFFRQILARQTQSAQQNIGKDEINKMLVYLPPISDQLFIAEILGTLDKKIDLNRQMNQTLEQMAQALYKSWFVDFDPVIDNALEAGNAIPGELSIRATKRKELGEFRKPLPDSIKNLFPSDFEFCDELDRWIPKGWKNGKVDEVAYVIGGGTPSTKIPEYFCKNGIPWLSPKDLSGFDWKFISKGATDITELGLKKSSANLMPKGTVLFSSRAPIGYIAIAENEICTNQGFKSLVPKDGMVSEYLFQYLKLKTDDIEAISTGSTFKEISGTAMKSLEILIPPKELLHHYKLEADAINDKMRISHKETKTLKRIRDTLLPKLISGEVPIEDNILNTINK